MPSTTRTASGRAGMPRRRRLRAADGSGAVRCGGSSIGSARGLTADRAIVPVRRYSASVLHRRRDARGRAASSCHASYSIVSPASVCSTAPSGPSTSSTRNRITVMLSRPPASLAAAIRSRPACSSDPAASMIGFTRASVDHRGEAVGVEHEQVAGARLVDVHVDLDVRLGAERAGDHRTLRVHLRLLLGELAAGDELADQRVVLREPDQVAAAQHVGARVADVGDRDLATRRRRRRSRWSPCRPSWCRLRERSWIARLACSMIVAQAVGGRARRAGRT